MKTYPQNELDFVKALCIPLSQQSKPTKMALSFDIFDADVDTGDMTTWIKVMLEKQPNNLYTMTFHEYDPKSFEAEYDDQGCIVDIHGEVLETQFYTGQLTRKTKSLIELKDEDGKEILSLFGGMGPIHASTPMGTGMIDYPEGIRRWFA